MPERKHQDGKGLPGGRNNSSIDPEVKRLDNFWGKDSGSACPQVTTCQAQFLAVELQLVLLELTIQRAKKKQDVKQVL